MKDQFVTITADLVTGEVEAEVDGMVGKSCDEIREILESIDSVEIIKSVNKPEYHHKRPLPAKATC